MSEETKAEVMSVVHHPFPGESQDSSDSLLAVIERLSARPDVDISKLQQFFDLYERMQANQAKKSFHEAFAAFKLEVPEILKNKKALFDSKRTGGQVSYDYATLDNVCDQLIPALAKHGITHEWRTEQKETGKIKVTCILRHVDGHKEIGSTLEALPDDTGSKNPVQAICSTTSYLERYTFIGTVGVAVKGTDNDANGAPEFSKLQEYLDSISTAPNLTVLQKTFVAGFNEAMKIKATKAMLVLANAKDARKLELQREHAQ